MCFPGEWNWSKVAEVWIFGDLSLAKKNKVTYSSLVSKERKLAISNDYSLAETPEEIGWLNSHKYATLGYILQELADFAVSNTITLKNYRKFRVSNFPMWMIKKFMILTKIQHQTAFANSNEAAFWLRSLPGVVDFKTVRDKTGFFYRCEVTLVRIIIHERSEEEKETIYTGPVARGETLAIILAGGMVVLDILKARLNEKNAGVSGPVMVQGLEWD